MNRLYSTDTPDSNVWEGMKLRQMEGVDIGESERDIGELERAVIDAAIEWRGAVVANWLSRSLKLGEAVNALLTARKAEEKIEKPQDNSLKV